MRRGAEVYSGHYLLRTRIRLKLARHGEKNKVREGFDISNLQSKEIRKRYDVEVKNKFEALGDGEDPEEERAQILVIYRDTAKKVNVKPKQQSKPWIGHSTWEKSGRGKLHN